MPSLLDIAPPEVNYDQVDIRGTKLQVGGIVAEQWAALYRRFPELRALVSGRTDGLGPVQAFAGQVAMIAAGLGKPADAETEDMITERLTAEEQRALVETIMRLSLPGHIFGPLRNGHAGDGEPAVSGKAADTTSPKPSKP